MVAVVVVAALVMMKRGALVAIVMKRIWVHLGLILLTVGELSVNLYQEEVMIATAGVILALEVAASVTVEASEGVSKIERTGPLVNLMMDHREQILGTGVRANLYLARALGAVMMSLVVEAVVSAKEKVSVSQGIVLKSEKASVSLRELMLSSVGSVITT